jgi:hypothetical protein
VKNNFCEIGKMEVDSDSKSDGEKVVPKEITQEQKINNCLHKVCVPLAIYIRLNLNLEGVDVTESSFLSAVCLIFKEKCILGNAVIEYAIGRKLSAKNRTSLRNYVFRK